MSHIGELIKQKRHEKDLTLFDLGVQLGIHPQTIGKLEKTGNAALRVVLPVCAAVGIESIPTKV